MSALDVWEFRAITVLTELQTAIARELAAAVVLREARERGADAGDAQRRHTEAMRATTAAFEAWTKEARP